MPPAGAWFDQSDQFMTDPSIAHDDFAVCEYVCDLGDLGRPAS
jgi:hypothetical protein